MSEALLDEISSNLKPILASKNFLTKDLSTSEKVNLLIVGEQVRINALKRQHELVKKLNDEIPARVDKIKRQTADLEKSGSELARQEEARRAQIAQLRARRESLQRQFVEVSNQLSEKSEIEIISNFQKNQIFELISKLVDLRTGLARHMIKPLSGAASSGRPGDGEYLSLRIEENEKLLKQIQATLNEAVERRFS